MKIILTERASTTFKDIEFGGLFLHNNVLLMKMSTCYFTQDDVDDTVNAVSPETGIIHSIPYGDVVHPVNGHLTIEKNSA